MTLLTSIFRDDDVAQALSDEVFVLQMIRFEGALAEAQGELGVIPQDAAGHIVTILRDFTPDMDALREGMERSSVPTVALMRQLRTALGDAHGSYVHWGATSQDVIDTALILQLRDLMALLAEGLQALIERLAVIADAHRGTVMAGRTHSQQALPITFGYKVAMWIAPLLRHQQRLAELQARMNVLQFGGAVGTLAALGEDGVRVAEGLAQKLGLSVPDTPWHTQRDNLAEFAGWLSLMTGSLAKMAQDIILMAQSEIAEVLESGDPARGGSSTMPQKRNPVISEIIISAARQNASLLATMHGAMLHEHERAAGSWQTEWATLPQMLHLTATALKKALFLSENLQINVGRMQANVAASNGLLLAEALDLALAPHMGRDEAKRVIKACVPIVLEEARHLVDVVRERVAVEVDWDTLRDEKNYLGQTQVFVDRVLANVVTPKIQE